MSRIFSYSVYILSNFGRTVFYIGVTSNLETRVFQHRNNEGGAWKIELIRKENPDLIDLAKDWY